MPKKPSVRGRADSARRCRGLYRLIRERLGGEISDREIARRWGMEWKSFAALKHGQRQVPRIDELERLAAVLGVAPSEVFAAASGAPSGAARTAAPEPGPRALQTLLERLPVACIVYDGDGVVVAANALVEGVCASGAVELVGRRRDQLFAGAAGGQVSWTTNRRGQAVYVHRTAGAFADGGAGWIIEVIVDVTDQVRRADGGRRRAALDRRESPRAETAFVVKYRYRRRLREARVENLGHGGLFLQTDEPLSQGAKLELEWRVPGDNAPVRATAVVAWSRAASTGTPAGIGVRFVAVG